MTLLVADEAPTCALPSPRGSAGEQRPSLPVQVARLSVDVLPAAPTSGSVIGEVTKRRGRSRRAAAQRQRAPQPAEAPAQAARTAAPAQAPSMAPSMATFVAAPLQTAPVGARPHAAPRAPRSHAAPRRAAAPADAMSRPSPGHRVADLLLTLASVVGVVVLGITITAHVTGLRPLVVKSGSMEPTIPTGGMVLVRTIPASDIGIGDVVAVERPDRTRVTHRVLEVVQRGDTAELTLKGDANEDPDPLPVTVAEAGRLVMSVPSIGRVSAFFASAKGGFFLGCLFTAVAMSVLRRRAPAS